MTGIKPLTPQQNDEIAMLREEMLRFAKLQLRDDMLAEDIVHDAINAALSANNFRAQSSLKSWLFSILRNKIIDAFRHRKRHPTVDYFDDQDNASKAIDNQFDDSGHWKKSQRPSSWGQPEKVIAHSQFWTLFEICLNHLPENTARVFMMREHLGLEISEICDELNLSKSNAWVIMHRARDTLRRCLENNFSEGRMHHDEL